MSSNCYYCGGHPDEIIDLRRRVAELEAECNRWAEASIAEDERRARWRAALEDIQPTEHDHGRLQTPRQAFETIIESLRYDGNDIDSLTIGEIRRALP